MEIIISCEHGGNYVPGVYKHLFYSHSEILDSHLGWDRGALDIAKYMAKRLSAPLVYQKVTRLLVEMNRSLHSEQLFSPYSRSLDTAERQALLIKYYHSYRNKVEHLITQKLGKAGQVLHISVHTFAPIWHGVERAVEIGLLFDKNRSSELKFAKNWQHHLQRLLPDITIMLNCPYDGADDGFTTYLRTKFPDHMYLGIEIEVSQKFAATLALSGLKKSLADSLHFHC